MLRNIAGQLERVADGNADYLGVFLPSRESVGKGGIDYERSPEFGFLHQFDVREELQSCGTALIEECESRIRARGLSYAEISVEQNNPRAQRLYERLGYVEYGSEPAAWDQEHPDGTTYWYETVCNLLRKFLR